MDLPPTPTPAPPDGPDRNGPPPGLSAEQMARLPLYRYSGPIHVVNSAGLARRAVEDLRKEPVLGFDTETRAAFRKGESYPPALVQLAGERAVWLFRLRPMGGLLPLVPLLSSPAVVKAGVALERDVRELRSMAGFRPASFVDLAEMADGYGVAANGLRGLAAEVLGLRVSKGAQRSNWDCPRLSSRQVEYAATDAWVCREVYLRLTAAGGSESGLRKPAARRGQPSRPSRPDQPSQQQL